MDLNSKKCDEGLQHLKEAEKCLKTSLMKWNPDYELAADEYTKAAVCFKTAKSYQQCRNSYMKAANCYKQLKSLFQAAKCLEQTILISKEMNDFERVAEVAEEACNLYQNSGYVDTATMILDKTGSILRDVSSVDALRLFQHAADIAMADENNKQAAEYTSKAARILIKLKHYDEAVAALRQEIGLHQQADAVACMGRLVVVLVLVHLARRDIVAAEKAFREWGNCCEQAEAQTLEALLQAYDEEDADGVKAALNSSFIKHMDVEYAKLARDLPLPKGNAMPAPSSIDHNAAPSYVSPFAAGTSNSAMVDVVDEDESDLR